MPVSDPRRFPPRLIVRDGQLSLACGGYPGCLRVSVARGNGHSADAAPDSGPEPDTGRRAPRIYPTDRARCTVANPQRSARATARTLSPAARRRRVSPSRAARFSGAPVARSCPRFQPARFPPGHKRPSSAGSASSSEDGRADGTSSRERSTCTAAGCHGSRARPSSTVSCTMPPC